MGSRADRNAARVPRPAIGVIWYIRTSEGLPEAAASGDDAVKNRDTTADLMTADQIAEARRMAREWQAAH